MSEQLRVWHIQNPPAPPTWYEVNSPAEGIRKIEELADLDLKNRDVWGNDFGLSVLEDDGEWVDWCDEEGNNIDEWAEKNEVTRDHDA